MRPKQTLGQLFDAIPDTVTTRGKQYCLRIEPVKGGLTFVQFVNVDNPTSEPLIHIESPFGVHGAMISAIKVLSEKVTPEWDF